MRQKMWWRSVEELLDLLLGTPSLSSCPSSRRRLGSAWQRRQSRLVMKSSETIPIHSDTHRHPAKRTSWWQVSCTVEVPLAEASQNKAVHVFATHTRVRQLFHCAAWSCFCIFPPISVHLYSVAACHSSGLPTQGHVGTSLQRTRLDHELAQGFA